MVSFRHQYKMLGTLWTDEQEETFEREVLAALEAEFGAPVVEEKTPLQHAVGWLCEDNEFAFENRRKPVLEDLGALRVCHCLSCGQRIVWKPAFGVCACSKPCADRVHDKQMRENIQKALDAARVRRMQESHRLEPQPTAAWAWASKKPSYAILQPDPIALGKIASDLQRQFRELHRTETIFVGTRLIRNKWVVVELSVVNGNGGVIYVVLNGGGPGRAAWTLSAVSADQAVSMIVGGAKDLFATERWSGSGNSR